MEGIDQTGNVTTLAEEMEETLSTEGSESTVYEVPGLKSAVNTIKLIVKLPRIIDTFNQAIANEFNIPSWFITVVEGSIIITITFLVAAGILKVFL